MHNFFIFMKGKSNGECISIAQTRSCRNRIGHGRKGRRRCEINFIPLVHTEGDINTTQRLTCRSRLQGFAPCPELAGRTLRRDNDKCSNSGRCSSQSRGTFLNPFLRFLSICERCDYGVLISGGWNVHMNQKRHLENLKDMRNYLKSKGFLERNMKIFYANNRSIDRKFEIFFILFTASILRSTRGSWLSCRRRDPCLLRLGITPVFEKRILLFYSYQYHFVLKAYVLLKKYFKMLPKPSKRCFFTN